jgi:predicted Rossmann-fold nucleotide-binding protein
VHGVGTTATSKKSRARTTRGRVVALLRGARQLARMLTEWTLALAPSTSLRGHVGRRPGIMEAANRGATKRAARPSASTSAAARAGRQPYITDGLHFEFHYFFMRKFWFAYLAKALVIFPAASARSTRCSRS